MDEITQEGGEGAKNKTLDLTTFGGQAEEEEEPAKETEGAPSELG